MIATGLVLGAVLVGFGVAGAHTSPKAPWQRSERLGAMPDGPPWAHSDGSGWGHFHGHGLGLALLTRGGHGEFTFPAPRGGSRTVVFQGGSVTSVGGSSITVKSDDGYTHTYTLGERTFVEAGLHGIGDVKTGDLVRVLAVRTGSTVRTMNVLDGTALRRLRGVFPWPPRD